MGAWLKLLGKADWKMPDAWTHDRKELLRRVRFGGDTPPTEIAAGDRLVYYAVGWERFFAIAEVTSGEPYEPVSRGMRIPLDRGAGNLALSNRAIPPARHKSNHVARIVADPISLAG